MILFLEAISTPIIAFNIVIIKQERAKDALVLAASKVQLKLLIGATDSSKYVAPLLL